MQTCSLCQRDDPKHLFTKLGRRFLQCPGCGLEWIDPMPSPADRETYYAHAYEEGSYVSFAEADEVRRWISEYRLGEIVGRARPGRWLDVGCSSGDFLAACADHGELDASGIEISPAAVRQAQERGLRAELSRVEDFEPQDRYDTITAFDVLEHMLDPHDFLARLHEWLVPGGTLVLTLPDVSSAWARWLMGRHWFYYWPDDHLFYYNPATVERLLASHGFVVEGVDRAYKPLSLKYSAVSLTAFNRTLGRMALAGVRLLPNSLVSRPWNLYIGEMFVVARRPEAAAEGVTNRAAGSSP